MVLLIFDPSLVFYYLFHVTRIFLVYDHHVNQGLPIIQLEELLVGLNK